MKLRGREPTALVVVVMVVMVLLLAACGSDDSKSGGSGGGSGGGSSASKPKVYGAGDSITVKNGATFVIALEANPSTGYSWQATANANVQFESSKQVQGTSNAIGASGTQQLTFKAVQTGSSTLTLNYLRPFDPPTTPPAKTQSFPLTVT
jgi:predicted secreted protein